jgi:hypothetical protein
VTPQIERAALSDDPSETKLRQANTTDSCQHLQHVGKDDCTNIFNQLAKVCPVPDGDTSAVITVVVDEHHLVGKQFTLMPDGSIDKQSAVSISYGVACQYYVPDIATLEAVLRIVSESPHAAITNAGWKHAAIGQRFVFLSRKRLAAMELEPGAVTTADGMPAFARIKTHAIPSTWQLLDRDEDKFTPEWAIKQAFEEWRATGDKILPGVANVKMLRAHSSSARVLRTDGSAVGGGNGHVWIKVADAEDAERTRTAILARAIELGLAWAKPRLSKATGQECGRGWATIVDPSVWTPGRLIFVGRPTCSEGLTVAPQRLEHIAGDNDVLDTSQAVVSVLRTYRASVRHGVPLRLSRSGSGYSAVMHNLSLDTEIELEDDRITTVRELKLNFTDKVRCQAPSRSSTSVAAFFALDRRGDPFVFDSGTDTRHVLATSATPRDTDNEREHLIREVASRLGGLIGEHNVGIVLDEEVLRTAWDSTFCTPNTGKLVLINENDELADLSVSDALQFGFRRTFGVAFNKDAIDEVITEMQRPDTEANELRKSVAYLQYGPLIERLKLLKQAKSLDISVDMFATRGRMTVADGVATVVLPHRPFMTTSKIDPGIVALVWTDYCQHFPEVTELVLLILHARFATDRRHAFVWLHCPSSWGKGQFLAIWEELGLVVDVTAAEIEKAMAGGPVGLSLTDTLRSWILFVDEFKVVSSELKLLNRQMSISPKNQLRCKVQLYTKLFASAESVRSLVGDGVEAQFNNRFAYLSPSTHDQKLEDRPLFVEIGKAAYLAAIVSVVAKWLNDWVDYMRRLGPTDSSKTADKFIEKYQAERRLQTIFGNLDDTVDDVVAQIRRCLIRYAQWNRLYPPPDVVQGIGPDLLNMLKRTAVVGYVSEGENSRRRHKAIVLGDAVAFVKSYVSLSKDRSTIGKMAYKADVIAAKLNMRADPDAEKVRVRVYDTDGTTGPSVKLEEKRGVVVFIDHMPPNVAPPPPLSPDFCEDDYDFDC